MEHQSPTLPTVPSEQPTPTAGWTKWLRFGAKSVASLLVVIAAVFVWVLYTQSGTKTAFQLVQRWSSANVHLLGVSGRLIDDVTIDQLVYQDKTLRMQADGVQLQWQASQLWRRRLVIDSAKILHLRIASAPSKEPPKLPSDLHLPLGIHIKQVAIGKLQIARWEKQKEIPELELTAITASLDSDAQRHQSQFALSSPWGQLTSTASISTQSPFALQAKAHYTGLPDKSFPDVGFDAQITGDLRDIKIEGDAIVSQQPHRVKGSIHARIAPFETQILRALQADLKDFNPADFIQQAPQARLALHADLIPDATSKIVSGQFTLDNSAASTIDQNQLPFTHLQSHLQWDAQTVKISDLRAQLLGAGSVSGNAVLKLMPKSLPLMDAKFDVSHIDLARLDRRLHSSEIKGKLQAQTKANQLVEVQAQLLDPHASLQAEASYQIQDKAGAITVKRFDLQADDSSLQASGSLSLAGDQLFQMQAKLQHLDPARWVNGPHGKIEAEFKATGNLHPQWQVQIDMPQLQGQYAGQNMTGVLDIAASEANHVQVKKLHLQFGKNQLNASGVWGSSRNEELIANIDAPDLATFAPLVHEKVAGSLLANVRLHGQWPDLVGHADLTGKNIQLSSRVFLGSINASTDLQKGIDGNVDGSVSIQDIRADLMSKAENLAAAAVDLPYVAERLDINLKGLKGTHRVSLNANFNEERGVEAQLQGGLRDDNKDGSLDHWVGQLSSFKVSGRNRFQLEEPMAIDATPNVIHVGNAKMVGELGQIHLLHADWMPSSFKTEGTYSDLLVVDVINAVRQQYAVEGDLRLNGAWNVAVQGSIKADLAMQRQSGDLHINDTDGAGQASPLGIRDLRANINAGGLQAGSDGERIQFNANIDGARVGNWKINVDSLAQKKEGSWHIASTAPLGGTVAANIPDIQWLGPWINPGLSLKGKLRFDAKLAGSLSTPRYQANLSGRELEVGFTSEGVLLPNGILEAQVDGNHITLKNLAFSNTITMMPRHPEFRDTNWIGQKGEFSASGELDIGTNTGNIQANWKQFPFLQRKDRWLVVSGQANVTETNETWNLTGKLSADSAYFQLPKLPPPSLSNDVVVINRRTKNAAASANNNAAEPEPNKKGLKSRLDFTLDMGPRFVFVGRGLDTLLAGNIRLRAIDNGALQASGSIRTEGGTYEGYGQKLDIERGVLSFQGSPNNPSLNVRALRKGLAVEAGVEVSGTVSVPQVRLVSEPSVPDAEKLSWLVLGRGSDQLAANDLSLLLSAASAVFGGDGSRNVPLDIVQGLGFDQFNVGNIDNGLASKVPLKTVAGSTSLNTTTATEQVVSIGKRVAPGLVLSIERGLSDASGALKLSWQVSRRVTIVGRAGTEASVDAYYTFSFK